MGDGLLEGVDWGRVVLVSGYKRDLITIDQICLEVEFEDGARVGYHEDMPEWEELLERLPGLLPDFPAREEWYRDVVLPPFETCETLLWRRSEV